MGGMVILAGGTGGAKLAAGMQRLLGPELTVIANTGDDIEVLGVHVSPDPDLVTYWLADQIDEERGWGIRDDTFTTFERMTQIGAPAWFSLSDRDLAACLYRREFMEEGGRQTLAQAQIAAGLGVLAAVLPMCDQPVRTRVLTGKGWRGLQEFLILDHAEGAVDGVEIEGIAEATPTEEVRAAIAGADSIVIGPSNPVISIGPILAVPGLRELIAESPAPVIAVSPFVGGHAVKGPTEAFMDCVGRPRTAAGVASLYAGVIDAMIHDPAEPDPPAGLPTLAADTMMSDAEGREGVAETVLAFAREIAAQHSSR
jgi:LPPG:FO 2-phospho-L-lactate transferase